MKIAQPGGGASQITPGSAGGRVCAFSPAVTAHLTLNNGSYVSENTLIFMACYGFCGHVVLMMWKLYVHLIPLDDDIEPHSRFTYVVVFLLGPVVFLLNALERLIFGQRK